jgi:uncharacterized membrane protein YcaP (DUF421 family)
MSPFPQVILSTLAIYLFLIIGLRILGRRTLSQLSAVDLVVIILLGSAVETSMVQASTSFRVGLVSSLTLIIANRLIAVATTKWKPFRHLAGGSSVLLVNNGKLIFTNLNRFGFTEQDVLQALREREVGCLEDVRFAVLEVDGRINVIRTVNT